MANSCVKANWKESEKIISIIPTYLSIGCQSKKKKMKTCHCLLYNLRQLILGRNKWELRENDKKKSSLHIFIIHWYTLILLIIIIKYITRNVLIVHICHRQSVLNSHICLRFFDFLYLSIKLFIIFFVNCFWPSKKWNK